MKISAIYLTNPVASSEYLLTLADNTIISIETCWPDGLSYFDICHKAASLRNFTCNGDEITELWSVEL